METEKGSIEPPASSAAAAAAGKGSVKLEKRARCPMSGPHDLMGAAYKDHAVNSNPSQLLFGLRKPVASASVIQCNCGKHGAGSTLIRILLCLCCAML